MEIETQKYTLQSWLWRASQAGVVLALAVLVWMAAPELRDEILSARYTREQYEESGVVNLVQAGDYLLDGIDPFAEEIYPAMSDGTGQFHLVALLKGGQTTRAGDYRLGIGRAALWDYVSEGEPTRALFCELDAWNLPWQPLSIQAVMRVRAVDSLGSAYESDRESLSWRRTGEPAGQYVDSGDTLKDGIFQARFCLQIKGIPEEAEWVRLEYDLAGTTWSLTIPLEQEETA